MLCGLILISKCYNKRMPFFLHDQVRAGNPLRCSGVALRGHREQGNHRLGGMEHASHRRSESGRVGTMKEPARSRVDRAMTFAMGETRVKRRVTKSKVQRQNKVSWGREMVERRTKRRREKRKREEEEEEEEEEKNKTKFLALQSRKGCG